MRRAARRREPRLASLALAVAVVALSCAWPSPHGSANATAAPHHGGVMEQRDADAPTRVVVMIPARIGTQRLALKNLRMLGGKPVIQHTIEAALALQRQGLVDSVIVNSDSPVFEAVARRCGAEFYWRPEELGHSDVKADDVVADFMRAHPLHDVLVWLNPVSPVAPLAETAEIVRHLRENDGVETLITVKEEFRHAVMGGKPLNFDPVGKGAKTQDLEPVHVAVYSIIAWRYKSFLAAYDDTGSAYFSGNITYYPVSKDSDVVLKFEADLRTAEDVLEGRARRASRRAAGIVGIGDDVERMDPAEALALYDPIAWPVLRERLGLRVDAKPSQQLPPPDQCSLESALVMADLMDADASGADHRAFRTGHVDATARVDAGGRVDMSPPSSRAQGGGGGGGKGGDNSGEGDVDRPARSLPPAGSPDADPTPGWSARPAGRDARAASRLFQRRWSAAPSVFMSAAQANALLEASGAADASDISSTASRVLTENPRLRFRPGGPVGRPRCAVVSGAEGGSALKGAARGAQIDSSDGVVRVGAVGVGGRDGRDFGTHTLLRVVDTDSLRVSEERGLLAADSRHAVVAVVPDSGEDAVRVLRKVHETHDVGGANVVIVNPDYVTYVQRQWVGTGARVSLDTIATLVTLHVCPDTIRLLGGGASEEEGPEAELRWLLHDLGIVDDVARDSAR